MSGLLNKKPWPDDSMTDYFVVDQQGNGLVNKATGKFLSNNPPDNHWEERDTNGGNYEVMTLNGSLLAVFNPKDPSSKIYPKGYLYWPNVPNV